MLRDCKCPVCYKEHKLDTTMDMYIQYCLECRKKQEQYNRGDIIQWLDGK